MIATTLLLLTSLAPSEPTGIYVEARTAAVYAGACHYGAQYTTQGREAVLGWRFDAGEHDGVSLAGVDLVVAVAGKKNLDVAGSQRSSVIYVDAAVSPAARDAAVAWLRKNHAAVIGEVRAVKTAPVDVGRRQDDFWLTVGKGGMAIELRGNAMLERECCRMPYNVLYEPFTPVGDRLVGNVAMFRWSGVDLGRAFQRSDENDAFFGAFGAKPKKQDRPCTLFS